jgi:maltokinase
LRDVAGMLRSFAYAASASPLLRHVDTPVAWEERARAEFLDGYRKTIDQHLVPSGASMDKLLRVFELEKAVYELRYELNNRPEWVKIPVAGIVRMLEEEVPV